MLASANDSTVTNDLETGDAKASNVVNLDVDQTNTNSGWAAGATALDLFGVGVGFVSQSNVLIDDGSYNEAYADSGSNVQGSLGQGNLTLQGAGRSRRSWRRDQRRSARRCGCW